MTSEERLEKTTAKLEAIANMMGDTLTDHEDRLRDLEASQNKGKGAAYTVGALLTFLGVERVVHYIWK